MMNELKKRLAELERLEEIADRADAEYDAEPENAEKEAAFDLAYQHEYNAFIAVCELIVKITAGQIDIKTARTMVRTKRAELLHILSKVS